jgi:uncharacterized protein YyaL (SSP411 family)
MNARYRLAWSPVFAALCILALISVSCGKKRDADKLNNGPAAVVAPELLTNQLGALPGAVYQNQTMSPIHWQPWTRETMERARAAQRLLFCVIAIPQEPGFQKVLSELAADPDVVQKINGTYVPVLIDGDAAREMGLLTSDLCVEIKRGLNLPLLLWMTCEGNPVAWIPTLARSDSGAIRGLFNQSHAMVSRMWQDSPDYVMKNSGLDNTARRARMLQRALSIAMSQQPQEDVLLSLRKLVSLYDPYSRTFDETGGLFPYSSIELLASAASHPGLPAETRARCLETTQEMLVDLLPSAMFDPLDGGVFASRRSISWSLPSFNRDCPAQARAAVAMLAAYRATGNARALDKALGLIAFAEKAHATPGGLFAVGLAAESDPENWMWSVEDVTKILGPEDAKWWIAATGMKGLGNLPSEVDPRREYFRCNTIGFDRTVAELAASQSQPLETFTPRFKAVKSKLLAVRTQRLGKIRRDESPHASSTFRMVSAYAAAFCATGDEVYRNKATALLQRAREVFAAGPRLRVFAEETPPSLGEGRAFIYALAMQAILDVAVITSENQWLVWSEDLATTSAELFTGDDFLKECPDDARLVDLPVTDRIMMLDDSTPGLLSQAECRLAELGRPMVESFRKLATPLPAYSVERPVLYTDLLIASLARHFPVVVVHGTDLPPELRLAIERLPMRIFHRRAARDGEMIPAGAVKVSTGGEEDGRIVTTPEALAEALLPRRRNQ